MPALRLPNSTQAWNCLFIISIILGLWKMALTICGKIEEVIFPSKCVLMMCCLMECHSPGFQNAGNSVLFLFFISMVGGSEGSFCEGTLIRDTWAPWSAQEVQWSTCWQAFYTAKWKVNKVSECSLRAPANYLRQYLKCHAIDQKIIWMSDVFVYAAFFIENVFNQLLWLLDKFGSCT